MSWRAHIQSPCPGAHVQASEAAPDRVDRASCSMNRAPVCAPPYLGHIIESRETSAMTTAHEPTLTVFRNGTPIFTSSSKWLHPLFELEAYLADHAVLPENLILQDKI